MGELIQLKERMRAQVASKPLAEQLRVSVAVERARKRNVERAATELGKARNELGLCAACEGPLDSCIVWHPERRIAFCMTCGTKED